MLGWHDGLVASLVVSIHRVGVGDHWIMAGIGYVAGCASVIVLDVMAVGPTIVEVLVPAVWRVCFLVTTSRLEMFVVECLRHKQWRGDGLMLLLHVTLCLLLLFIISVVLVGIVCCIGEFVDLVLHLLLCLSQR